MKKFITLTLIAITTLLLAGCKKEKEEFSLVGKTFICPRASHYVIWKFISETEMERSLRTGSPEGPFLRKPKSGSYSLNYPYLIVTVDGITYNCDFIDETSFRTHDDYDILMEFHQ
ncbi:MAG: hypothetical protein NC335_02970 [Bacteroides sp.]|nr:hypothetical protein [Bacteroides sp.]